MGANKVCRVKLVSLGFAAYISSFFVTPAFSRTDTDAIRSLKNFEIQTTTLVSMPRTESLLKRNLFGTVVVLGDSFVNIPERFFDPLKSCFSNITTVSNAPGYISPNPNIAELDSVRRTRIGQWTDIRIASDEDKEQRDKDGGFGADGAESHAKDKSALTVRTSSHVSNHTVILQKQPLGGRVFFRTENTYGKIDTRGENGILHFNFPSNDNSITLVSIGPVNYLGHIMTDNEGWSFHKLGNSGAKAQRYLDIPEEVFSQHLKVLKPDAVIIVLGTNDNADPYTSVLDYKNNMVELTDRIKRSMPNTDILLFGPNENAEPGAETSISRYNQALYEIAVVKGYSFFDSQPFFGTHADGVKSGLIADDAGHPTKAGGILNGNLLCDNIFTRVLQ